jgi:triacylglycerol lipase
MASVPLADVGLAGVNDPTCSSTQRPVVLLHGTLATAQGDFGVLAPALQATGRCVFALDYGMGGIRSVRSSAKAVAAFVDRVLEMTGADAVDVIGYSQGGLVLRTALRLEGLAPRVAVAVLIAPTFHGSTSPLLTAVPPAFCPACADQAAGSALLDELDAGGDLDADVRYAVISSRLDTVVTPVSAQAPVGPPDRVTALVVQDRCPDSRLDHLGLRGDPGVVSWVVDALDTDGFPDPSAFTCG